MPGTVTPGVGFRIRYSAICAASAHAPMTCQASVTRWVLIALTLASLAACVVVPRTVEVYDEACRVHVKQMTLEAAQIGRFGGCYNEGCLALLVATGAVAAASAVVSGSIAVVGNIVYWAEKQGRCVRDGTPPPPR